MIACGTCGADTPADAPFCVSCGADVRRACPVCGAAVLADARFCHRCGSPQPAAESRTDRAAAGAPAAERRMVTVLFADLVDFTARAERQDPEAVASFLADYFGRIRDVADRFGGLVEKYVGDAVMVVWGARVANEDDAERAVRAGLEMQETVAKLAAEVGDPDIALRVGILTGEAAVRAGDGNESTGMIVGDLVNSAARLQQTAEPGAVVVGESTHRAASRGIAFEPAGTPDLKGKQIGIAAWRALRVVAQLRGRNRAAGLDPPFVGRQDELQLLKDLLGGVIRDGRARLVSIVGEVGIGKSRLVWELQKYADGLVHEVYWNLGRSPSYGTEGVAYGAVTEMLRARIGLTGSESEDAAAAALERALDEFVVDREARDRIFPWLAALLCCGPSPEGDRSELDAAIRGFLAAMAAAGPTVLVFEDLQWADAGLLDLVEHLVDWVPEEALLVIAVTRPDLLERRSGWVSGRRRAVTLRLGPLDDADMEALLVGMVGELDPAARATIVERAAGIPLYAVELVRMITAEGGAPGSVPDASDLAVRVVPETLQSLIDARIDRLDPDDRTLLQDAAVLGRDFTVAGLAALTGRELPVLRTHLDHCVARELLEPIRDPRSPMQGGYRFVQELIREVAHKRMSREVRSARHVAAAEYVESIGGPDQAVIAADHYLSALDASPDRADAPELRSKAVGVLVAALDRAASLYAHEEVLSLGRRVLQLDDAAHLPGHHLDLGASTRADVEERMASAASALARHDEAERRALRAIELRERAGDRDGRRRAVALAALVNLDGLRADRAEQLLTAELEDPGDAATDPDLAHLLGLLARAQFLQADYDNALATADRALIAAENLRLRPVIGDALVTKATTLAILGRPIEAQLLLESVLQFAERHDLTRTAIRASLNLGAVVPQPDVAGDPTSAAIKLGRRVGNLNFTMLATGNRVFTLVMRAEWEETDALLADPLWQSAAAPLRVLRHGLTALGEALRGHREAARASIARSLAEVDEDEDENRAFGRTATAALAHSFNRDVAEAVVWAGDVLSRIDTVPSVDVLARVVWLTGDRHQLEVVDAALRSRPFLADARMRRAVTVVLAADPADAASIAVAEEAIDDLAGDLVIDRIVGRIGLARILPGDSPDAARLLADAAGLVEAAAAVGLAAYCELALPGGR
jgi:class 3 adenylate cyclase/tetratricopeptide (TPR) repeat protein